MKLAHRVGVVALVLALAGCGSNDADQADPSTESSLSTTDAGSPTTDAGSADPSSATPSTSAMAVQTSPSAVPVPSQSEPAPSTPPTSSMETPMPTSTSAPQPTAEEPVPAPPTLTFDLSMVRDSSVSKVAKGGQADVEIVVGINDMNTLKAVGIQCVDHFLTEQKAAYCRIWASDTDYGARDPEGIGDNRCWMWFLGIPLIGGELQVYETSPSGYTLEGCPGGVLAPPA